MRTIYDFITASNIAAYVQSRDYSYDAAYLGRALFPDRKQAGLNLAWLRDHLNVHIALRPSSFDVKAELRDRIGFSKAETEMAFFKEAMRVSETDRQKLLMISNEDYVAPIIARIFDDYANLIDGVEIQAERMRMQLLTTGEIAISRDGAAYAYDYQFPADHKDTITVANDKWSATSTADPLDDIEEWVQKIQDDGGEKPTRAICSPTVWRYLRNNLIIQKAMNPVSYASVRMAPAMVREFILDQTGILVEVYDKTYRASQDAAAAAYWPADIFTLIPDGILGNTYYGTTPEEADLMGGKSDAEISLVNTGTAVTTTRVTDPVTVDTKVSAVLLPTFPKIDSVFIADVA